MAHRTLTAALAVASVAFVMGGAPVDDYDGPARWESTTVTISADLEDAAKAWGDTVTFKIDDDPQISTYRTSLEDGVAGEAQATYRDGHYLDTCRIAVDGDETPAILSHELGHCLGLTHSSVGGPSNMHWWAGDYQGGWSDTVTPADLDRLANLYTN